MFIIQNGLFICNRDLCHDVPVNDFLKDVHALGKLSEYRIAAVEVGLRGIGDKELGTVGIGPGVSHRNRPGAVLVARYLVVELVSGAAGAFPGRVAALRHKAGDYAVKRYTVIIAVAGEENEIIDRLRRVFGKKIDGELSLVCLDDCRVLLFGIYYHRRICGVFLGHFFFFSLIDKATMFKAVIF